MRKKKVILNIAKVICAAVFVGSLLYILNTAVIEPKVTYEKYDDIRNIYNDVMQNDSNSSKDSPANSSSASNEPGSDSSTEGLSDGNNNTDKQSSDSSDSKSSGVAKLSEDYPNIIGWIRIEGTLIDYPVLYKSEDNKYYLNHDYSNKKHKYGSIFLNGYNSVDDKNLIIFGHNIKNEWNNMFRHLTKFENKSFFDKTKTLYLDIGNGPTEWEIIGVAINKLDKTDAFFTRTKFYNDEDFELFVTNIKENCLYTRDFEVGEDEQMVCLATCSYHSKNCRTVVIAKRKISE